MALWYRLTVIGLRRRRLARFLCYLFDRYQNDRLVRGLIPISCFPLLPLVVFDLVGLLGVADLIVDSPVL